MSFQTLTNSQVFTIILTIKEKKLKKKKQKIDMFYSHWKTKISILLTNEIFF